MTPAPLLLAVAVLLAMLRAVWWLAAHDRIFLRASNASPTEQPDTGDCPPAVTALTLSAADGGACFLLDQAASAAVADLVERGALTAQTHNDDALLSMGDVESPNADDALLIHMLQTRMSRTANGSYVVDSGTIAHHQPNALWWLRYRRAVTLRARELGLTQARPLINSLLVIAGATGVIGVTGVLIGLLSFIRALTTLDPLSLNLWWPVLGVIAIRLSLDSVRTAVERSDVLTAAGRNYALRLSHRRDQLVDSILPADGIGSSADVADATAVGIHTRVTRQIPLVSTHTERLIWSDHSGSPRLVRVRRDWRPGEGTRPSSAIFGGLFAIIIALMMRRIEGVISASDWFTTLTVESSSAVEDLDQLLSFVRQLVLVPLIGGTCVSIAGIVDLFATTTFSGKVIDVQLPESQQIAQKIRAFFTGAGHDGIAIVEVTLDLDESSKARTIVVDARAAAPVGAEVSVDQTLILRRVKSIRPRGSSGAEPPSASTLVA